MNSDFFMFAVVVLLGLIYITVGYQATILKEIAKNTRNVPANDCRADLHPGSDTAGFKDTFNDIFSAGQAQSDSTSTNKDGAPHEGKQG